VPVPLSLTGRYQLVVIGAQGDAGFATRLARLKSAMNVAFGHLGINPSKFLTIVSSGVTNPDIDPRMPSVGIFFGFVANPTCRRRIRPD